MFVTTSGRPDTEQIERAKQIAQQLMIPFVLRKKRSVQQMQLDYGTDCLIAGKNRIELHRASVQEPFFFHPNLAMIRIKRLLHGETDPYLAAAAIKNGSTILDCTLGLGADALVASFAVGDTGMVTAIEENTYVAFLVERGLSTWDSGNEEINQAMRRINVCSDNHLVTLKKLPDKSFDVVYFDPMFDEGIEKSVGIKGLGNFAFRHDLTIEAVNEAKRVAKNRVVLKDHFRSKRFEKHGFNQLKRKSALFHYGYIEV